MTDVMVQNMATNRSAIIKIGAAVTKIAVFERRLAVQLQDSLHVYGLPKGALQAAIRCSSFPCMHGYACTM